MSSAGIHRGYLRKYGGLVFKQWKEKFLYLSVEGSLQICRDTQSPPDLEISLHTNCSAILDGKEINDMPKLPMGTQRENCLALILRDGKFLLLLASTRQECSQWLNILRKVKESLSHGPLSPGSCKLHIDSPLKRCCWKESGSPYREKSQTWEARSRHGKDKCSPSCLRHGSQMHGGVKAACLLMGGAAAGPSLGYMVTSTNASNSGEAPPPDFKELGYHPSADVEGCGYNGMDYEGMDHDFDAFDFGGFAF
ncbi:pleckstrin homology domain-containing family B member 1-like [Pleurodeles waltl]|uniref:pleckstrin homology domain-containing family B member 1-like n=1 Tax=Pleurodeles waltl TaxID=8319 RepID=UPI0037097AEE